MVKRLQPTPTLMAHIESAFLSYGYSELSMIGLARACDLSPRALYYYFSNKEEAFRASVQYGNDVSLNAGFAAGRSQREAGSSALTVLSDIINTRYGIVRRKANASRHLVELNAEVFRRCNDIVTAVALYFEAELAKMIVELQRAELLDIRPDLTPEQVAQALANGARGVNQRLPPVAPEDLADSYREMCRFILYGCADIPMTTEEAPYHPFAAKPESRRS